MPAKAMTAERMLSILNQKHNNRFQYPNFIATQPKDIIQIICPEHRII